MTGTPDANVVPLVSARTNGAENVNRFTSAPCAYSGEQMIVLGDTHEGASRWYENVEVVSTIGHVHAMAKEHFPLMLCRKPKGWTLQQAWPQLKRYN